MGTLLLAPVGIELAHFNVLEMLTSPKRIVYFQGLLTFREIEPATLNETSTEPKDNGIAVLPPPHCEGAAGHLPRRSR